ncbi:MAG: type II secretion system protein [Phycisphaerales bacterium]|nr:type II secretion system protein [Phycisphaerales bacterium]
MPARRVALRTAFTMTELLVVVGVIALLVALSVPAVQGAHRAAARASELAAVRQVSQAWLSYATDQQGQLIPGFKSGLPAFEPDGTIIPVDTYGGGVTIAARWPWRLAPYFAGDMRALYVGDHGEYFSSLANGDHGEMLYFASLYPSFAMNTTWVGGDSERMGFQARTLPSGAPNPIARFYVSRLASFVHPQRVSVFVSSRTAATVDGTITSGYFRAESPWFVQSQWAARYDPDDPVSYGNVNARFGDEAVVASADGAVEAVAVETLRDMRRWADQAYEVDYRLTLP